MSSFIVSDTTINSIVTYIDEHRYPSSENVDYILNKYGYAKFNNDQLAQMLLEMNYQGTNARYGESKLVPRIEYHPVHTSREQALKSMECLHYQASEGDVPKKSKTYKFLEALIGVAADNIVSDIPAFKEAQWNMADNPKRKKMRA